MRLVFGIIVAIFFIPFDISTAERREGDLAVLNIQKETGVPEAINLSLLRRIVMEEAAKLTDYRVMTEENVFAILRDKGVDPNKCGEFECAVEYGRLLQADKIVVGSLSFIEDVYYLTLTIYDASSAAIDKTVSRKCPKCRFDDLVEVVRSAADELFGAGRKTRVEEEIGVKPERWELKEAEEEVVKFESEPEGAMVEIDGKPLCNTPCSKLLREGAYKVAFKLPKHLTEEREIIVKKGMVPFKVKLTPDVGYISVQSEPDGIDVFVNKEKAGKTPLNRYEVEPGRYEVLLKDPRFYETGKVVDVGRGEEKVLSFKPVPREGGIKVRAFDEKENALEADVYLDGKKIGRAPGSFKVIIGEHEIRVEKENSFYEKGINVEEKKIIEVEAVLKRHEEKWLATSTTNAPSARIEHTAVWTGSEMIIWGGYAGGLNYFNDGGRYNPSTDSWTPTSTINAPEGRRGHTAVWTGSEMIVWGGRKGSYSLNTGGRYNPSTDSWTPTSTINAPEGRDNHTAVWTGSEMIVWGGRKGSYSLNTGGRYDPSTDSWTPTSTINAPEGRMGHTAVWTGKEMIVWGGYAGSNYLNTGGRYNPLTNSWTPISTKKAPSERSGHTAIWTGTEMIIWGGFYHYFDQAWRTTIFKTGGRYNPLTDSWTSISTKKAPSERSGHTAIWTGTEMIIWGGYAGSNYLNTGGRYNPLTNSWTPTSTINAPEGRGGHTAVWTGKEMIVWGGEGDRGYLNTGGRYNP